jgi:hypothetical protein
MVDAGEKGGVEGAPIVSMGENAVYLVKEYRKEGRVTPSRRKGLTQPC